MSRILKYQLSASDTMLTTAPGPVIAVAWQHGALTVWCVVPEPAAPHQLAVLATGEHAPGHPWRHAGSAVSDELVFHVYQRAKE